MAVDQEPFTDVRVRQAMRLIVDRDAMVEQVLAGYGRVANDLYCAARRRLHRRRPAAAQARHRGRQEAARRRRPERPHHRPVRSERHRRPWRTMIQLFAEKPRTPASPSTPRSSIGGTYWGDAVPEAHVRHRLLGYPQLPAAGRRRQPQGQRRRIPDDHWPPADSTFEADYKAALAETDDTKRKVITDKMQKELYDNGGLIIPFFQNLLDAYNGTCAGSRRAAEHVEPRPLRPGLEEPVLLRVVPRRMSNNRGVLKFIARRLALGVLTLFVVSLVVFAATQLLPSDPAQAILGRNATTASVAALRDKLGLDHTAFYQYTHWLKGIVTGDPGDSFNAQQPILSYIGDRVVNSLFLLVLASVISIPLSLWFGGYSARKRDTTFDNVTSNIDAGAGLAARVRRRHHLGAGVQRAGLAPAAGGQRDRHRPRAVVRHEGDDPADRDVGDRCRPLHLACGARVDDRGAGERLRRDGPAEGCAGEGRAVAARASQRARPGVPGHRPQHRLLRRRRHRGRGAVQLSGHRWRAARLPSASATSRSSSSW